jgi:hypothetical protein
MRSVISAPLWESNLKPPPDLGIFRFLSVIGLGGGCEAEERGLKEPKVAESEEF